jgi:hypothetical protein
MLVRVPMAHLPVFSRELWGDPFPLHLQAGIPTLQPMHLQAVYAPPFSLEVGVPKWV